MELKIYKIKADLKRGRFKEEGRRTFPLGNTGESFYSLGNLMRGIEDLYLEGNLYLIEKEEDLEKFFNPLGKWIANKKYYLNHPKKERENFLLEGNKFHEYILREQLLEVSRYLKENFKVLKVSFELLGGEEDTFLGLSKLFKEEESIITYEEGKMIFSLKKDKDKEDFIWIKDFKIFNNKELLEKERNFLLTLDNSFGISEKIGKRIGIKASCLKEYSLKVSF